MMGIEQIELCDNVGVDVTVVFRAKYFDDILVVTVENMMYLVRIWILSLQPNIGGSTCIISHMHPISGSYARGRLDISILWNNATTQKCCTTTDPKQRKRLSTST